MRGVLQLAEQRGPLVLQGFRRPGVHVGEQLAGIEVGVDVHPLADSLGEPFGLGRQPPDGVIVQQAGRFEVRLEARDGVAGEPALNLAGFPAISLPVPVAEAGRPPAGLQIVGSPRSEALLVALAARIEEAVAA